jgi:dihydrofolate reductase
MRSIIQLAHVSLDGYLADKKGDFNFVSFDDELSDYVYPLCLTADTAIYGRTTYQLMESYWPSVLDDPKAEGHAKTHARWYANVKKIVASRTLPPQTGPTTIAGDDIVETIAAAKRQPGGPMMIFASPTLTHTLTAAGLVDEWLLTWQPVILGGGLPLFGGKEAPTPLALRSSKTFRSGVVATHHAVKR